MRARTYNKTQNKYSGWERKRGAITEFIRFLKKERTSVHTFIGDQSVLPKIKFIIALDADTNLLYESAQTLVSVAMHPLNRPVINSDGVVTAGYGILCPKISTDLQSAKATSFSRVMSGCGGVTAYETRDKDYYQDLFGESIFAGKGLIHIDSFYNCLSDRFPDNQVLSHDILEGAYLRCGFVSDVEMTDGAPANMTSWLARLHRWLRGDWQNVIFLGSRYRANGRKYTNPISRLSKFKLFDNLRRSLTCIAALLCMILALFAPNIQTFIALSLSGILSICFPSLWAALNAIASGGFFTLSRKFFTRTLPHTMELIAQGLFHLIMLPAQAFITLDAVLRSLWRTCFSRRKMLEWTTAAQADMREVSVSAVVRRYWLCEAFAILFIFFARSNMMALAGILFAAILPVAYYSARRTPDESHTLSDKDKDTLLSYNAAMWRYYEDFANETQHYLPPDNIQQSPVYRVATRTSPTNIGFLLLSTLVARDLGFIDTPGLYKRIDRTLTTVEKLATWNGNLYNWYDTLTLDTLKPEFVSCVDSGNFICCLVALREGLSDYASEKYAFKDLSARIDAIIDGCDLTVFYNKRKKLFSIGYDAENEKMVDSHYDFLMSEARLTSYYAVARKIVGKKHWGQLVRTMSRNGSYAGPVSWTGTMFEFFMPHLLLPVYDGSLLGEALTYCLYCQKKRTRGKNIPWGISESAFYAFDNNLNYQYKAHGVQKIGVKRHLDKELVISPYSTFITIPMNPNSSMRNLGRLRELGVYGRYGFYEAVDFTEERVGQDSLAVTRSYMAHHIGMSMAASCNALRDNILQKRFMRDHYMKSAKEFLQEKIAKNTIVYDEIKSGSAENEKEERPKLREESGFISPLAPKCALLSNGELTDILTDSGVSYLKFGSVDVTRRGTDMLRHPQGFIAITQTRHTTLPATMAPFYDNEANYTMEYQEQAVTFNAAKKGLETSLRCVIHPTISCQQRCFTVKNTSSKREDVDILFYFEPVLSVFQDYNAHPAYSKLFVTSRYDPQTNTLTFKRRNRDGTENMFFTVGFLEDTAFTFETRRETLMHAPQGLVGLFGHVGKALSNNDHSVPDACCAVSMRLNIAAGGKQSVTLLACAARNQTEGIEGIISMRNIGELEPRFAAKSPILMDSLEGRLSSAVLGQILFNDMGRENTADRLQNNLGQSALWCTGISGDMPIALIENPHDLDGPLLESYIKLHGSLRAFNVEFDLVILYDSAEQHNMLLKLIDKNGGSLIIGAKGGIYLLHKQHLAKETLTLLRAVTRHFAIRREPAAKENPIPFLPVQLEPVQPQKMPESPDLVVSGGCFKNGRFYVSRTSPLPWSHVLATGVYGTLVSDTSLGFTWAINARENKLTPWYNDIATDNDGELLLLRDGDSYLNLTNGALASFSKEDAQYDGICNDLQSCVRVTVSAAGCAKYIDVTLKNLGKKEREAQCAYYIEPVLGVNRETARHICPEPVGRDVLVLRNPYNTAVKCAAALSADSDQITEVGFMTDRAAFLAGDWHAKAVSPENDPCAAVIIPIKLPPHKDVRIRYILAYGQDGASAAKMAKYVPKEPVKHENTYIIDTPDQALNQFINHFAPHQILSSRINGRCAFYQCGGAYGFRDQLQDVCAYVLIDPAVTKRQILRCCHVQFEEGDVLHWWHDLPQSTGGLRGVRTKFSDDLLWLPLAVAEYVEKTGDMAILATHCGYLTADPLGLGEHEKYIAPARSAMNEDVFSHCARALEKGYNLGDNGLPLIGCGDWNDGFSSVGLKGHGTSVWLALFLSHVLRRFAALSTLYGRPGYSDTCLERADALLEAVDKHCWDGAWYVRAFYDDGTKMGTHKNDECYVDLLPQSFAVLAGMPDKERVHMGMDSAWRKLVDQDFRIVKLFQAPFQHSRQQPGYVKAYPSGIRENGGQYTHAAVWFALALLENGDVDKGWAILEMLNPVDRASRPDLADRYKLEPYYMAADIYTNNYAYGRGGWSMYTGAASWYYRVVIENLLGIKLQGDYITIEPKLPSQWPRACLSAVIRDTKLTIAIRRGVAPVILCDGKETLTIPLDGNNHDITVTVTGDTPLTN
uniref:Bifunctional glycosyltransferase family 84 / glycoside hydrolase family 94 protein n=1 Tax=termite gut metagenome TaxID=433724 RepID=S0DDI5_9ZZZZ